MSSGTPWFLQAFSNGIGWLQDFNFEGFRWHSHRLFRNLNRSGILVIVGDAPSLQTRVHFEEKE